MRMSRSASSSGTSSEDWSSSPKAVEDHLHVVVEVLDLWQTDVVPHVLDGERMELQRLLEERRREVGRDDREVVSAVAFER